MNIHLSEQTRKKSIASLQEHLANLQILRAKTQGFHWNVQDPSFEMYHALFETQYNELSDFVDDTAERIRSLGDLAPQKMETFISGATLKEVDPITKAGEMMRQLLLDYEAIIGQLRGYVATASDEGDEGTADFFVEQLRFFEKTSWMIRSSQV